MRPCVTPLLFFTASMMLTGCGSEENAANAASDAAMVGVADGSSQEAAVDTDAAGDATVVTTSDVSSEPGESGMVADARADAALLLAPVQCKSAEDCQKLNPQQGCFQSKPGGVCAGCDIASNANGGNPKCPTGTECITGGTGGSTECAYPCHSDDNCIIGLQCSTSGPTKGHCQSRLCGDNMPACPSPYTFCRETGVVAGVWECARPRCQDGCPAPLVCPDTGGFCLEP